MTEKQRVNNKESVNPWKPEEDQGTYRGKQKVNNKDRSPLAGGSRNCGFKRKVNNKESVTPASRKEDQRIHGNMGKRKVNNKESLKKP